MGEGGQNDYEKAYFEHMSNRFDAFDSGKWAEAKKHENLALKAAEAHYKKTGRPIYHPGFLRKSKFVTNTRILKEAKQSDPPPVIVLRRIGLRVFPTGERVALYSNDKLGLNVSIPYSPTNQLKNKNVGLASIREDLEVLHFVSIDETITKKLASIAKGSKPGVVHFADGSTAEVQPAIAARIIRLYKNKKVNFTNRVRFTKKMSNDRNSFRDVVDFTASNS